MEKRVSVKEAAITVKESFALTKRKLRSGKRKKELDCYEQRFQVQV